MQIEIQTENYTLPNDMEDYIKLHLGFDDSGAYDQVENVLVKLSEVDGSHSISDVDGSKNSATQNCFITIKLEGIPMVIDVQNTEEDMHYAIDLAAKRARKTALLWLRRYGKNTA